METKWRCWRCKKVSKMGDPCSKCNKYLQDYPYNDFQSLLMCVKKHAIKPSFDKKSFDSRLESSTASLQLASDLGCKRCGELLYTGTSEYCHRCRPKCEECNLLFAQQDSSYCEDCLRKKREAKHFETIERAIPKEKQDVYMQNAGRGTCTKCHLYSSFTKVGTRLMCGKCYLVIWPEDMHDFTQTNQKAK